MRPRPPEEIARIERMREDAYEEATIQKAKEIEARRRMAISDV